MLKELNSKNIQAVFGGVGCACGTRGTRSLTINEQKCFEKCCRSYADIYATFEDGPLSISKHPISDDQWRSCGGRDKKTARFIAENRIGMIADFKYSS
ncbi:MAG: hypothetical protein KKE11_00135 [Gammaproteobacteria bacterium]|nr:hypothetical protein [Gammaproteobacteria bacterium]